MLRPLLLNSRDQLLTVAVGKAYDLGGRELLIETAVRGQSCGLCCGLRWGTLASNRRLSLSLDLRLCLLPLSQLKESECEKSLS